MYPSSTIYVPNFKSTSIIYIICILFTFICIGLLPFLKINISVHSSALIRPTTEISVIRSLVNGRVKESFITENQSVQKGDVLYVIESEPLIERERFSLAKKQDVEYFIHDLNSLIHLSNTEDLITSLYQQSYYNYQQKVIEVSVRLKKTQTDYNRNFKLHSQKVIADSEFETHQFELDKAKNDLEILKQTQLSQWQSELRTLK